MVDRLTRGAGINMGIANVLGGLMKGQELARQRQLEDLRIQLQLQEFAQRKQEREQRLRALREFAQGANTQATSLQSRARDLITGGAQDRFAVQSTQDIPNTPFFQSPTEEVVDPTLSTVTPPEGAFRAALGQRADARTSAAQSTQAQALAAARRARIASGLGGGLKPAEINLLDPQPEDPTKRAQAEATLRNTLLEGQLKERTLKAGPRSEPVVKAVGPGGQPVFVPQSQAAGRTPFVAPKTEPVVPIIGPDGKPILVPRTQAVGKTPFSRGIEITSEPGGGFSVSIGGSQTKKLGSEQVKNIANVNTAIQDMGIIVESTFEAGDFDKGTINRRTLASSFFGLPFTSGRDFNAAALNVADVIVRFRSGAAVRDEELANIVKGFIPTLGDTDSAIRAKVKRTVQYLQDIKNLSAIGVKIPKVNPKAAMAEFRQFVLGRGSLISDRPEIRRRLRARLQSVEQEIKGLERGRK